MKILIVLWFLISANALKLGQHSEKKLPPWVIDQFNSRHLDRFYQINSYLKTSFLSGNFTGDHSPDYAVLIINKQNHKKGFIIFNSDSKHYYVIGAGQKVGEGGDDLKWADTWSVFKNHSFDQTSNDPTTGDILNGKKVKIKFPSILIVDSEQTGYLITWTGSKFISLHQGE